MILKVLYQGKLVGILSDADGNIAFQYDKKWIESGFSISPKKLPLNNRVFSFSELKNKDAFLGLPGIFADSVPDKWGNAIIKAHMSEQGITNATQLQKLAYIGQGGMGALTYEPTAGKQKDVKLPLELVRLVKEARRIASGKVNGNINEIISVGSSAGGARAKAVIAWNKETNEIKPGNALAPEGFEHWIIKFEGVEAKNSKEWPKCEEAFFSMAKDAGINVPEFTTIKDKSGLTHFLIKRFDRRDNERILTHTFSGMLHNDFNDQRSLDYSVLLNTTRELSKDQKQVDEAFRRCVFNVLTRNQDDHSKNFSFLYNGKSWDLAPAYDLNYSISGWCSEHQMTIAGASLGIKRSDLLKLANQSKVLNPNKIIDQVVNVVKNRKKYFTKAKLSSDFIKKNKLNEKFQEALYLVNTKKSKIKKNKSA